MSSSSSEETPSPGSVSVSTGEGGPALCLVSGIRDGISGGVMGSIFGFGISSFRPSFCLSLSCSFFLLEFSHFVSVVSRMVDPVKISGEFLQRIYFICEM